MKISLLLAFGCFAVSCEKSAQSESKVEGNIPTESSSSGSIAGDIPDKTPIGIVIQFLRFGGTSEVFAVLKVNDSELTFGPPDHPKFQCQITSEHQALLTEAVANAPSAAWSGHYYEPGMLDGGGVICTISRGETTTEFMGINASPLCFTQLLEAIDRIAGEEVATRHWLDEPPTGIRFDSFRAMADTDGDTLRNLVENYEAAQEARQAAEQDAALDVKPSE